MKKLLVIVISMMMVLAYSVPVFAETVDASQAEADNSVAAEEVNDGLEIMAAKPVATKSGTYKNGTISWSLASGKLTLAGSGSMEAASYPWDSYSQEIKQVVIGDGITDIGANAFDGCEALESVQLASTVKTIGTSAFYGCTHLTAIDLTGVDNVKSYAFDSCSKLTTINMDSSLRSSYSNKDLKNRFDHTAWYIKQVGGVSGASASMLWEISADLCMVVSGCGVVGDDPIVGDYVSCATKVIVEPSITQLAPDAFICCPNVSEISVPANLVIKYTDESTVYSLFEINSDASITIKPIRYAEYVANPQTRSGSYNNGNIAWLLENNKLTLTGSGSMTAEEYPWAVYADAVKTVSIGEGITNVGDKAFANYKNLKTVELASSVKSIGYLSFYGCSKLDTVAIPANVKTIEAYAFQYCSSLKEVAIPDGINTVKWKAFDSCYNLATITMSDSVASGLGEAGIKEVFDHTPWYIKKVGGVSGTSGSIKWSIDSSMKLVMKGSGLTGDDMLDGNYVPCAKTALVEPSITQLTPDAFCNCPNLTKISVPSTLKIKYTDEKTTYTSFEIDAAKELKPVLYAALTSSNLKVSFSKVYYDGTAKAAKITSIKCGSTKLKQGVDYEIVSYSNNINAGSNASVTIRGIGKYSGTVTKKFTISKASQKVTIKAIGTGYVGNSVQVEASSNAKTSVTITYKTSNKKIATVNSQGKVTFLKAGKVKIYATAGSNSNYNASPSAYITIKVVKPANQPM